MPYALPDVMRAGNKWIFLCEGEKDAINMQHAGFIATTFGGASDCPNECMHYFKDKKVFIVGDYDQAGAERVHRLYDMLTQHAKVVKHTWLKNPNQSKTCNDVTDWFSQGGTPDALKEQVNDCKEGYEPLPKEPTHKILSFSQLCELPSPEWLVHGFLQQRSTAMIFGKSGSYKSFTALDMSLCIATGKAYFDYPVVQGSVLYIAGEGAFGYRLRSMVWSEYYQTAIKNFYMLPHALDLVDETMHQILLDDIEIHKLQPKLLVVDTLARCFGSGDENSASDMTKFIQNLDKIRNTLHCTILIIHHAGKSASAGARGSSALLAAMDTSIEIAKQDMVMTMTCDKQKDGSPFEQMQFEMVKKQCMEGESLIATAMDDTHPVFQDDEVLKVCKELLMKKGESVDHPDIPDRQLVINRNLLREHTLHLFEGGSGTKARKFREVVERLIAKNEIKFAGSSKGNQYFWVMFANETDDNYL